MARIGRVVIPTVPHHITQRGGRRMETFFGDVRMHERTGRPLGGEDFVTAMSSIAGRELARKKLGQREIKYYVPGTPS